MSRPSRNVVRIGLGVVLLVALWLVRPIFHGLAMYFWTQPIAWLPPAIVLIVGIALLLRRASRPKPKLSLADMPAGRPTDPRLDPVKRRFEIPRASLPTIDRDALPKGPGLFAVPALALVAFIGGSIAVEPLTASALYRDTEFEQIDGLPAGGIVRVVPKDVAETSASSGFNSSTEQLSNFSIVNTADGLEWTSLRTPNSTVRTFSKKSQGLATLDASTSERELTLTDAEFEYAPGLQVTDNLRWQLLKRHFLADLADPVGIRDQQGRPRIIVPYVTYRGFPTRRPQLGGVFLVSPDGTIEDLSPEEASQRPEIASSGRLFPPTLAREIQDAYAYKNGIWNKLFLHEEQTRIVDTEQNPQPYMVDFGDDGVKWVTVAEPYGRAFAVNAIFMTDAVTGETQIWNVPPGESLSGNRRALQTVRSLTIPGVVFANDALPSGGSGRFRVVEPRPVFANGRLVYLVSIIPEQATSISKTVVIDAALNKQVAIFDNAADRDADQQIERYLTTGRLPSDVAVDGADLALTGETADAEAAVPNGESGEDGADEGTGEGGGLDEGGGNGGPASDAEVRRQLDDLIERQRQALRDTERLREALEN